MLPVGLGGSHRGTRATRRRRERVLPKGDDSFLRIPTLLYATCARGPLLRFRRELAPTRHQPPPATPSPAHAYSTREACAQRDHTHRCVGRARKWCTNVLSGVVCAQPLAITCPWAISHPSSCHTQTVPVSTKSVVCCITGASLIHSRRRAAATVPMQWVLHGTIAPGFQHT